MLELARAGRSALLVAATGAGKTLAGFLPAICELAETPSEGLHTLYVSPLKALAVDVQRNLIGPIEEMGLPIRVETRTGDTPSDRKARQRVKPPQILLTTPESLSLLLSYPDAAQMFANLRTIVVDELHGFAKEKRGDLLSLSMSRLQKLAPGLRRVGLSATISDPDAYRSWLAPDADMELVDLVIGDPGAEPDLSILIPENKIPWGGHSGRHAAREVMELIEQHKTTLVFCNTRSLAELIFQDLWAVNDQALPIGIHHGSLAVEARRKVEAAMAEGRLRGLVATASLDLGIDWGDVDLVVQMGAPKGSSRLLQRIGRANHRLDEPSKGMIVPGNRFEYLEARAALDAIDDGELDPETFRPGALDVLAQHILAMAVAAPFQQDELLAEVRSAAPYAGLKAETFEEILNFIATGGYALKAYDRFRRLVPEPGGMWRIARPAVAQQHRLNAGVIVEQPLLTVRFRNGRRLGTIEEGYASTLSPGDNFYFSGLSLEVEQFKDTDIIVRASSKRARIVTYGGQRMSMSTHLANRVRHMLADRNDWSPLPRRRPRMARSAVGALGAARTAPAAGRDLPAREAAFHGRLQLRRVERAPVARHADHAADGERGPEAAGLRRQRLCARLLRARADHRPQGAVLGRHPRAGVRRLGRKLVPAQDRVPRGGGDRRAGRAPASRASARPGARSASRPTSSTTCCAATSPSICCCARRGTMRGGG